MKTKCTMKHLCILILAAFLLASCSGKEDIHQETEDNAESTDMVSGKETEETRLSHALPEDLSFDGGDFTFLGVGTGINFGYYSTTDLWVEGETGEVFNDAIFKRNNSVEELLDIAIRVIDFDDTTAEIKRNVTAGDPLYDAVWANGNASFNLSASGCFLDFHTIPYIHLEKPWWDQNIQNETLLKRKLSRDSESAEMLDIIAASRTYSVMAMTNWGGLYSVAGSAYNNGKTVSVSDFEKKLQTTDTQMQKDLARFAALES